MNAIEYTPSTQARIDNHGHVIADGIAIAQRNLIGYTRVPELLVFSTVQPVMLVVLFRYVFGGAINVPGVPYVDYLMPGIFCQTVVFGAMATAIGLATDMQTGLIERFRSLPMARSAVLTGRTSADLARNVLVLILMGIVGVLVGWSGGVNPGASLAAMGLILLFGYAMSWVFAVVGLMVRDPETAQAASFPVLIPIAFASSAFVPVDTMPSWLQGFATYQPLSVVCTASRDLLLGTGDATGWVLGSLAWCVGIIAVAAPLTVARYRRST